MGVNWCTTCGGSGKIGWWPWNQKVCPTCKGTGLMPAPLPAPKPPPAPPPAKKNLVEITIKNFWGVS